MGTNPVNLIDAIAETNVRQARSNTAVIRIGKVVNPPTGGTVDVSIAGFAVGCQWIAGYYPLVNDIVAVVASKDGFLVIGSVNDVPGGLPMYAGQLAGTYATGWGPYATYPNYGYRQGGFAFFRFNVSRTGVDLATNVTTGNLTDALLFTISDERFWPAINRVVVPFWSGGGFIGMGYMDATGGISLASISPGFSAIVTGTQMGATAWFPVLNPA